MVASIYMANATAQDVAKVAQSLGLVGTVVGGYGFGLWGVEPTVVLTMNTEARHVRVADRPCYRGAGRAGAHHPA